MAYYPPSEAPDATTTTKGKVQLAGDLSGTAASPQIAADAVTATEMLYGMLRGRRGGTTGDSTYITAGTSNTDTSAKNVFFQAGAVALSTVGTDVAVTFPNAYAVAPLVICSTITAGAANVGCTVNSITTTGFNIRAYDGNGSSETAAWFAIGQA